MTLPLFLSLLCGFAAVLAAMVYLSVNWTRAIVRRWGTQNQQHTEVMGKLSTLSTQLQAHEAKVDKVLTEVSGLRTDFDKLKEQLEDADIPDDAQATLDRIGAKLDNIDAINPDKEPEQPPA